MQLGYSLASVRFRVTVFSALFLIGILVPASFAQWGWGVGEGNLPARFPPESMPDRDFAFCKVMYDQVRYEELGMGWSTDYPYAGINLMHRLEDLTTARISSDRHGQPNHWVVRLTDDELFQCPFIMASDVGTIGITGAEAVRLREYLLKGGFSGLMISGAHEPGNTGQVKSDASYHHRSTRSVMYHLTIRFFGP